MVVEACTGLLLYNLLMLPKSGQLMASIGNKCPRSVAQVVLEGLESRALQGLQVHKGRLALREHKVHRGRWGLKVSKVLLVVVAVVLAASLHKGPSLTE
jgi:hypothetical protein